MTIDYGRDIRSARLARGWSRQRLAEESGLTVDAVSAIESGRDGDPAPAIDALELQELRLLLPDLTANFLRTIQPVVARIDETQLPVTLAAVLDIVGRAAAGMAPDPDIQQVNVVSGDATVELTVSRKLA